MKRVFFSYTDDFNETVNLEKIFDDSFVTNENTTSLEMLLNQFRMFLLAAGFAQYNVNKIDFIEQELESHEIS